MGLQGYRSLCRVDNLPNGDISFFRGNAQVVGHIHVSGENNAALFFDIGRNALLGVNIIRNINVAVTAVKGNASAGNQFAVVLDDEVSVLDPVFTAPFIGDIGVFSGCHGDIAGFRNGLTQDINGSQIGSYVDILFRLYRFIFFLIINTDVDIPCTRFHRYASILRLNGLCNGDAALAGYIRSNVPGFSSDVSCQGDMSVAVYSKTSVMPCYKICRFGLHTVRGIYVFRQFPNVNAAVLLCRNRGPDLDIDIVSCLDGSNVIDSVSR